MDLIVEAGIFANNNEGRTRNGFFVADDLYLEMSQLSFLHPSTIKYRILGYDYGDGRSHDRPTRRIVELPWQLAPHGRAIFTDLELDPREYEEGDKIAYRLISPYIGEVLVKAECCTAEELVAYERVSGESDPDVHYTTTAEECALMPPSYETYGKH